MNLTDRLNGIIDDMGSGKLTTDDLGKLKDRLNQAIAHEEYQRQLFLVMREDPRENIRLQYEVLRELLSSDGIEVSDQSAWQKDDQIRWTINRRDDPTDGAVLIVTKDNVWSVGISYPKKSDLYALNLRRLLERKGIDPASLGGWKFATSPSGEDVPDPDNHQLQFNRLREILADCRIEVPVLQPEVRSDGASVWDIFRRDADGASGEWATLVLSAGGGWSIQPLPTVQRTPGDLASIDLAELLRRNKVKMVSFGGWRFDTNGSEQEGN
jgi:hypothetical protein